MTTVSPVSERHVLCATAFMVPLGAGAPQPLALFLWGGGGGGYEPLLKISILHVSDFICRLTKYGHICEPGPNISSHCLLAL